MNMHWPHGVRSWLALPYICVYMALRYDGVDMNETKLLVFLLDWCWQMLVFLWKLFTRVSKLMLFPWLVRDNLGNFCAPAKHKIAQGSFCLASVWLSVYPVVAFFGSRMLCFAGNTVQAFNCSYSIKKVAS